MKTANTIIIILIGLVALVLLYLYVEKKSKEIYAVPPDVYPDSQVIHLRPPESDCAKLPNGCKGFNK